ncbi:uncharacterized protein LOC119393536 isoform X1 [Rhipicephalus sanguineus]|uniref:uncharacterized protein LOC119393536 isoform X1 n=1 Tax=Rhipicephalus sanguineus TaxID=34632 RepID=UPI0018948820|nr:uncharacterized protein LOC119393536 isoform X1 [Rhipicephalus sanguineus]
MLRARSVTLGYSQFVLVLGVTLLLAASAAGASSEYNPEVAVEEVGRLFNLLFPLVLPDKMPYSWPRGTAAASSVDASDAALAQVAAGGGYGGQRRNPDDPASRASSLNLPKRGESECLSRCMSQRKLHPIQCLNIC